VADAVKQGYRELGQSNEYFFELRDSELLSLIIQVTGVEVDSNVAKLTLATLKQLKAWTNIDSRPSSDEATAPSTVRAEPQMRDTPSLPTVSSGRVGLNLSYTINLNLPATSDQAVFNAIFRSLKEHLLSNNE